MDYCGSSLCTPTRISKGSFTCSSLGGSSRVLPSRTCLPSPARRRPSWLEGSSPSPSSKADSSVPSRSSGKRSEEHTSELQSLAYLVCRLLLEKKKKYYIKRQEQRVLYTRHA